MRKELKIFTTYHSISPKDGINISLFQPKFKHYDNTAKLFVPTYQLFKIQDYNVLTNAWNEKLKQTFNEKYLEQYLYDLQGDNDRVVLCCYEKDRNTCHRKIIGDFITLFLGIEVKELDNNKNEIINKIINEKLLENSDATTYELLLKQLVKFSFDKNNQDSFRLLAIDKLLKELKEVDKEDNFL